MLRCCGRWLSSEVDSREKNEKRPLIIIERLISYINILGLFKYYQIIGNRDLKTNRAVGNLVKTVEIHQDESEFEERYIYKYAVVGSAASIVSNLSDVIAIDADGDHAISKLMNLRDAEVGLSSGAIMILIRRILIWSMMKGEIDKCRMATDGLYEYFRHVNFGDDHNAELYDKFEYVIRELDIIREKGTEGLKAEREVIISRISLIRNLLGEPMRSYKHTCNAVRILLTDDKGFCRLCKCGMVRHIGVRIILNLARRRTIDVQCKLNGTIADKELDKDRMDGRNEIFHRKLDKQGMLKRAESVIDKLKAGMLNSYVSHENTCYMSGPVGKMRLPICMDTFILKMCGITTYINSRGQLLIFDKWSSDENIYHRPVSVLISDPVMKEVVHMEKSKSQEMEVVAYDDNVIMIAGKTDDVYNDGIVIL